MDILEVIQKKNKLELDIWKLVNTFHEDTNLLVDFVGVETLNAVSVSGKTSPNVYSVKVEVKL